MFLHLVGIEPVLLHPNLIHLKIRGSDIFVGCADQGDVGKIVIRFHHQHALDGHPRRCQRTRWNLHSLPPADPTSASSSVNRLPSFNRVACRKPEGRIWNSAVLVVSTTGPPSRTSTLMSEGRDGAGFGCCGCSSGFVQLSIPAAMPASVMPRMKEYNRGSLPRPYHPMRFILPFPKSFQNEGKNNIS